MSFTNLGAVSFLAGLAAIAGILFVLQRLRVRFSEREVATTLFWKQAVEETRARMLMRRFRHPLPYLLALLIGALVWLAFAEPDWNRDKDEDHVFLLDGSAGMAWGDRFERAKVLLRQEADRLPAERRRIYFCGADARLILDHGEETSLLIPRLAKLAPEACPSSIEREMLAFARDETASGKLRLLVVGDAPVSEAAAAMLPDSVTIERLQSGEAPQLTNNTGIAAIGVADAASGAFDRVDVMIEIAGTADAGITLSLADQALNQAPAKEANAYYLRDLPARGEVLEVALAAKDAVSFDDRARITLPDRRTVTVAVDDNLDARFHAIVTADPALVPATETAQVVVGGAADGSLPAIELVTGNGIAIVHEEDLDPAGYDEMRARFAGTGLDRVGWKLGPGSERVEGYTLAPRYVPGPQRKIQIGVELIGNDSDFLQTSAFPLFMSTAIRWLAMVEPVEPFAVAGEQSVHPGRFTLAGSDYAPPRAGRHADRNGNEIELSLAAVGSPTTDVLIPVTRSTEAGHWPAVFVWCILAALLLVGAEWLLFQKSRIP